MLWARLFEGFYKEVSSSWIYFSFPYANCLDMKLLLQVSWNCLCTKNLGLHADLDVVDQAGNFFIVWSGKGVGLRLVMILNYFGIVIDITSLSQTVLKSKVLFALIFNVYPKTFGF